MDFTAFFKFYYNLIKRNEKVYYEMAMNSNIQNQIMFLPTITLLFINIIFAFFSSTLLTLIFLCCVFVFSVINILTVGLINNIGSRIKHEKEQEAIRRQREKETMDRIREKARRQREQNERQQQKNRDEWEEFLRRYYQQSKTGRQTQQEYRQPQVDQNRVNAMKLMSLQEGFSEQDLKKRYRELSKVHHPDLGGLEVNFIKLNKAYNYLLKQI